MLEANLHGTERHIKGGTNRVWEIRNLEDSGEVSCSREETLTGTTPHEGNKRSFKLSSSLNRLPNSPRKSLFSFFRYRISSPPSNATFLYTINYIHFYYGITIYFRRRVKSEVQQAPQILCNSRMLEIDFIINVIFSSYDNTVSYSLQYIIR
jgi:hypothetical protein